MLCDTCGNESEQVFPAPALPEKAYKTFSKNSHIRLTVGTYKDRVVCPTCLKNLVESHS